jgi:hypothetical protein
MVEVFAAWRQGHLQPAEGTRSSGTVALDARLARIEAMMDTALTYRTGEDKGDTKDVATSKQAGRIIAMIEEITKAVAPKREIVNLPGDIRNIIRAYDAVLGEHRLLLRAHERDYNIGFTQLAAEIQAVKDELQNSAPYAEAERQRLRADRLEREVHGLKSAFGRILKIEADAKQPDMVA